MENATDGGGGSVGDDRPVLALLDGHSLAYRAFFALPEELATTTGQRTNAVFGFTSMLIKLLAEHHPDRIAVMFDKGRPAERLAVMPEYKANRTSPPDDFRSQLPLVFDVLDVLQIPRVQIEGTEADDLIASYASRAVDAGLDVLVVSGDRDVFQLVDDHVSVVYTRRGISDTVLMDAAAVRDKYGVEPGDYPMLAALRGDPSDNIPGVPGVGDKTAAKLLEQFGDLESIFRRLDEVRGAKLPATLAEHERSVLDGHRVAVLRRDVDLPLPLDALVMGDVDHEAVRRLFTALEFRSLWERLTEQVLTPAQAEATAFEAQPLQLGAGGLRSWVDAVPAGTPTAVLAAVDGRPPSTRWTRVGLAAVGRPPAVAVLDDLAADDRDALRDLLADAHRPLVTHDAKRLDHAATSRGWTVAGVELDTELAAYLVAPGQRSYDLESLANEHLHKDLTAAPDADAGSGGEAGDGQLAMVVDEVADAAALRLLALRAHAVGELDAVLGAILDERDQRRLLVDLELPLVGVLARIERTGIAVDTDVLDEISHTLADRLAAARDEVLGAAGVEFNLDSPKQLQAVLFDDLGLPKTKRTKTGYSTDAAALTGLLDVHPMIAPLLTYREVSKLKGTYADALPATVDPSTGRIHATFNQTRAVTGRLSSDEPNLQNIPIRSVTGRELRRAFVPGEGYDELLVADYSQVELRVMAHLSQDEGLLAAFASAEDIHATTAAMVWDLPIDAVDTTLRSRIKGMTYGLAYGLSAYGLGQQLGIPPDEARELMEAYFARFPQVRAYLDGVVDQARRDGYTSTLLGRRRYLPDLTSDRRQRREMAERMALNAPIQGTAADIIKLAMIAVDRRMRAEDLTSRLLLQVHDELVCEVTAQERDAVEGLLVEEMSGVVDLSVPLTVDTASGRSWFDAEKH